MYELVQFAVIALSVTILALGVFLAVARTPAAEGAPPEPPSTGRRALGVTLAVVGALGLGVLAGVALSISAAASLL